MQIKIFNINLFDSGAALDEMNKFLRSRRILNIREEFVSNTNGNSYWTFCIQYLDLNTTAMNKVSSTKKQKIDYKSVLDAKTFEVFSSLRACRKIIAQNDAIPAFAVFTDAELASIAQLNQLAYSNLIEIKGIGKKRVEKYGKMIIQMYFKEEKNEKSEESSTPNS